MLFKQHWKTNVSAVTESAICALNEVEGGREYMPCIVLIALLCRDSFQPL